MMRVGWRGLRLEIKLDLDVAGAATPSGTRLGEDGHYLEELKVGEGPQQEWGLVTKILSLLSKS